MSQLPSVFQADNEALPAVFRGAKPKPELPKVFQAQGFYGQPVVDPEANRRIVNPMIEKAVGEVDAANAGRTAPALKTPIDPANPYPSDVDAFLGPIKSKLPAVFVADKPTKPNPTAPYNAERMAIHYPELMPKVEERNLASEFGMAMIRPFFTLGGPDTGVSPGLLNVGPSRDDLAGNVANFAGGFVPGLAAGPGGPLLFGADSYKRTLNRTDGSTPAAVGAGLLSMGLGMIPTGELTKNPVIAKVIDRLGGESKARRYLIDQAVEALMVGGTGVGMAAGEEGLNRAGGATPQDISITESLIGMLGAHYGLKAVGVVRTKLQAAVAEEVRQKLVQTKLVTPEESALVGANKPAVYADLALRRAAGEKVRVEVKDGRPIVVSEGKDSVDWATQQKLGHDPVAIQFERDRLAAGGKPWFVDKSALPPTPEEITTAKDQLTKAKSELDALIKPTELTELGAPVTPRALLAHDITNHLATMGDSPTRLQVTQAEALAGKLAQVKDLVEPIPEVVSSNALKSKEPQSITSEDLRKVQQINYPLPEAEKKGYFKPVDQIAKDPKNYERLAQARRKALEAYQVLNDKVDLDPLHKIAVAKQLDAEYQLAVEKILAKDTVPTAAKVAARKRVNAMRGSSKLKLDAHVALDRAFEAIAKRTSNETAQGIVDRLRTELRESPGNLAAWDHVLGGMGGPDEKLVQTVRRAVVESGLKTEAQTVIDHLHLVPKSAQEAFAQSLARARTPKRFQEVVAEIKTAADIEVRRQNYEFLQRQAGKLDKARLRDKIIAKLSEALTPAPKAKGKELPETVGQRAMKINDVVYEGKPVSSQAFEEDHATILERLKKDKPELAKQIATLQTGDTDNPAFGFVTSKGRFVDRAEALKISQGSTVESSKAPTGTTPAAPKPVARLDPSTVKTVVDTKAMVKALDRLSHDQVQNLTNDIRQLLRQGALESGLYNKYRKFSQAENETKLVAAVTKSAEALSTKAQQKNTIRHFTKNVFDAVTTEGWLAQLSKFDPTNPIYKIFHQNLVDGQIRQYQNEAESRRFFGKVTQRILGQDYNTPEGKRKLGVYLTTPVVGKITRGEAINAWLVAHDPGRQDVHELGVKKAGTIYAVKDLIATLSPKDIEFAKALRSYFVANPVVEKAFQTYRLLNGFDPPRTGDHWVSSREPITKGPSSDWDVFKTAIEKTVDPLRDRKDGVNTPYEARDVMSEFMRAHDSLSRFGEMGLELYQAAEAINSPKVTEAMTKHWGQGNQKRIQAYLSDIMGSVGIAPTPTTEVINHLITNYSLSKIVLNVFSASKQSLDVLTFLAEGTLSKSAIAQATAEGAWLRPSVAKEMIANSGMAYLRYHGHYLDNIAVLSEKGLQPSKLDVIKEKSLFMQQAVDRSTLSIAWRASQIEAQRQGYKGAELQRKTSELFNLVVGRAQPTSNPLYSGELEVEAKRQPLLRGAMVFMRAPNRIYNVVRRRVVEAAQNPTDANVRRAGQALIFGVIGNTLGIVGINALRRAAYNTATDAPTAASDVVDTLAGDFYLGAPAGVIVQSLFNSKVNSERMAKSPFAAMGTDLFHFVNHLSTVFTSDSNAVMKSGPSKGDSKQGTAAIKALDEALSLGSGVTGMPIWGVWNQARGYYRWTQPQQNLMVEFEQEKRQLKTDGREKSLRYQQLEKAQTKIEKYHQMRKSGLATESETQRAIEQELRQVVR